MKHYSEKIEAVFQHLKSQASGLSSQEAKERLLENGANKLADPPKIPLWKKFLMQFADPMIIVLLAAALISLIMAIVEGESLADVFIILFVVVLNAVLGVLAKVSPQLNMFAVGLQLKVLVGLAIMFFTASMLPGAADFIFTEMKTMMVSVVEGMM